MCALDRSHKSFSLTTLGHRLLSVPMFLALLPFVAGIVLSEYFVLPVIVVAGLILLTGIFAVVTIERPVALGYVAMALLFVGYLLAYLRDPYIAIPYDEDVEMVISVEGIPSVRGDYRVADGRIEQWRSAEQWYDADYRVVLWLRADNVVFGDRVTMCGRLSGRLSRHEGYDDLMRRRGFIGGVGVNNFNVISVVHAEPTDMQSLAVRKLDAYATDRASHATVVAMVAGSRHDMPAELRAAYSETGLAHLMAVSGLHIGIVLMVVGALLIPLRFVHRGHRLAALLSIVAIWVYAIMSGSSPSVMRAAIMLTVLQLARASSSKYNSINVLSVTVFVMLVARPDYLYDVSFQLSVAAVFGIVAWGVPLMRVVRRWRLASRLFALFVVGAVATLWTLPIVSHTFGNLPIIGVVLTPCVLLFSYVIVVGGVLTLLFPSPLAMPFAVMSEWAASVQNGVVEWAAQLPFAAVDYTMPAWGVAVCYLVYAAITVLYWSKNQKKVVTLPRYDYD